MKKTAMVFVFVSLVACTTPPKQNDPETKDQYITNRRAGYLIDGCSPENMPSYPKRPRLTKMELVDLTGSQMDTRIQTYITATDHHIDILEAVIEKTRQRVDRCR